MLGQGLYAYTFMDRMTQHPPDQTLKEQLSPSFLRHIPESENIAQELVAEFVHGHPEVHATDTEALARLIWLALATALDNLDDAHQFAARCRELGRSFVGLGLRPRHFPALAQLLLRHLCLDVDEADAWNRFVLQIERAMVSGSKRTGPAPAPS